MVSKESIIKILKDYTKEMEGYSYYGSNMGVSEDDYDEIVDKIMELRIKSSSNEAFYYSINVQHEEFIKNFTKEFEVISNLVNNMKEKLTDIKN